MLVLGGDLTEGVTLALQRTGELDLLSGVGEGAASAVVLGLGDGPGVGRAFGGEGCGMVSYANSSQDAENARMDSTTLLGLAGIGGTLLGTAVGAGGTLGAARVTSRGQSDVEEQKARRQAFSACSTALLARRDAAVALLETFVEDSFDSAAAQVQLQNLDEQRDGVARAVGAVSVEGPYVVAHSAEYSAYAIEVLTGRLRDWVASVAGGEDRGELVQSQMLYGREDQRQVQQDVDAFTAECRKVLHPTESRRRPSRRLSRR